MHDKNQGSRYVFDKRMTITRCKGQEMTILHNAYPSIRLDVLFFILNAKYTNLLYQVIWNI